MIQAMAFSPDNRELAAVSNYPRPPRLLCWDSRGQLVIDEPVDMPKAHDSSAPFYWLPDCSGWLIGGNLYDRETKRIVLKIEKKFSSNLRLLPLDRDRLLYVSSRPEEIRLLNIPWERIAVTNEEDLPIIIK
jgi:hypothetical protein